MTLGTSIEWCDATFNPWWGCERVSPGCAHCYGGDWSEWPSDLRIREFPRSAAA